MCKYSKGSWNCPYEKLPDSEYCIFHLEDENKNADEFNRRINELFENKDQDRYFIGFIFSLGTTKFDNKYFNKDIYKTFTFDGAIFLEDVNFSYLEFSGYVSFSEATFHKNVYFDSSIFTNKECASFDKASFFGTSSFHNAKFLGGARFINTEFYGKTYFINTEFGGTTYFSRAKFFKPKLQEYDYRTENVEFDGATFLGEARFKGTMFSVNVSFSKARFLGETNFSESIFSKKTYFDSSEFIQSTYFYDAKFLGKISFYNATFSDAIGFNDAEFCINSDADFGSAKFEKTDFKRTKFYSKINFSNAKFFKYTYFNNAIFFEFPVEVNFENVEFSDDTYFKDVKFLRKIFFKNDKFKNVYFNKVEFQNACFDNVIFSGETEFRDIKFLGEASFIKSEFMGKTIFQQIELYRPVRFSFATFAGKFDLILQRSKGIFLDNVFFGDYVRIKANLTRSYFQGSNIEIVDLTDSEWELKDNNSIIIWEDYQRELNCRELEGIYRRLKQSYQRHGNYSTSGKFYYREMDLHGDQLRFVDKLWWNIGYKYSCGYGEKPFNVLFVSIAIIFMFAIIYFYYGILVLGKDIINYNLSLNSFNLSWIGNFVWCLYMSIAAFTTMGFGDVQPIGLSRIFAIIEAGIGIFMTALFIFVFTRKMLR